MPQPTTLRAYWELMRFHKPIGILLLLWPTWWALWLAAEGWPDRHLFLIFTLGVIVMRAAGCIINDIADQPFDGHVARTQQRPLVTGALSLNQAKKAFAICLFIAFILVLLTNLLTIGLAVVAALLACAYPFMKRHTHLPQVVLGAAFSMSIPMAFAAQTNTVPAVVILIYVTNLLWTVVYDTFYGMVDREYDKKIGVKSTAILFEGNELIITGSLQSLVLIGFCLIGQRFDLGLVYFMSIAVAAGMMFYHQLLLSSRHTSAYFKAFYHNHWLGLCIFIGIFLHFTLSKP